MDKNEHNQKMEELKTAMHEREYEKAAQIADTLDLKKIKDNNFLSLVADAYEVTHNYQQAKKVLLLAYENTNAGRHLAYRLCLIAIKTKEYDEAEEFYGDFVEMAPRDTGRYILRYKMAKAKDQPIEKLIEILEEYVNIDMEEKWAYELARLYHMSGDEEKCVDMCDEISLWFAEGKYVIKAMELKKMHQALTASQLEKYEEGKKKNLEKAAKLEAEKIEEKLKPFATEKDEIQDFQEIEIKPIEDEKFNTMDIQAVIADGMKEVVTKENVNIHEGAESTKIVPDKRKSEREESKSEEGEKKNELKHKKKEAEKALKGDEKKEEAEIAPEPINDLQGVENMLRQLQERGILKAETVSQAVHIIDDVSPGEKEGQKEQKEQKKDVVPKKKNHSGIQVTTVNPPNEEKNDASGVPVFDLSYTSPERDTSNDIGQESMYENMVANSDLGSSTDKLPTKEEIDKAIRSAKQSSKGKAVEKGLHTQKKSLVKVEILSGAVQKKKEEKKEELEEAVEEAKTEVLKEVAEETKIEEPKEIAAEAKIKEPEESETEEAKIEVETEIVKARKKEKVEETKTEQEKTEEENVGEEKIEETPKEVLTEEELSFFRNYSNIDGFELNIKEVLTEVITSFTPDGKSSKGNVIIMGDKKTGKTTLAIEIIKLINKKCDRKDRRLAKVDAKVLNRRGFRNSLDKLLGSDLIVENADQLGTMLLREIVDVSGMHTDDMIILLEGESEKMEQFLENYPKLLTVFNHVIRIKEYDIKEWAEYGKQYAVSKGYCIDELADLAFHKAIDDFFGEYNRMSKGDIEIIVDQAISKSKRFGRKLSGMFTSKKDEDGLYILVESDFNI